MSANFVFFFWYLRPFFNECKASAVHDLSKQALLLLPSKLQGPMQLLLYVLAHVVCSRLMSSMRCLFEFVELDFDCIFNFSFCIVLHLFFVYRCKWRLPTSPLAWFLVVLSIISGKKPLRGGFVLNLWNVLREVPWNSWVWSSSRTLKG